MRRTLARLDVSARSFFAIIDQGSCFAGTLLELALAADRSYMLALGEGDNDAPRIALSAANFGAFPMANGLSRLETRIFGRLSAWQNWIFNRPNAVGEKGALKLFGSGSKPQFNRERV